MGHTNFWKRNVELPSEAFAAAVKDCRKLLKQLKIPLAGGDGTGKPIFRDDLIEFNGKGPEHCETFAVSRITTARHGEAKVFEFCKTNERSYDLAVQCALIVLKHHLGEAITVSSDGADANWEEARKFCQDQLGYGDEFRLEK
jgi:hypothetical protein